MINKILEKLNLKSKVDTKILLGLKCKSCGEKIMEKERWGKETLCLQCEEVIKYGM